LGALQTQNGALRRELAARQAELAALYARLRGQAEAARLEKAPPPAPLGGVGVTAAPCAAEEGVEVALAYGRLQAVEAQLRAARDALHALDEELRLSRREVQALQRTANAEAVQREALEARLKSTAELLRASDEWQAATEALAAAAQAAERTQQEQVRATRAQSEELRRQQRAWQTEREAHVGRLQLVRKQEALLRKQNELAALLLAQQRATSRALETEVQALEVRNAQLEARCKSYLDERRAMI